ncbi:MAG: RdgB/HAM1 family non-canonical purine NTP pyrophosphatase [Candidatus Hermodarchaeota archaeon]
MNNEENAIYFVTGNNHKYNEVLDIFTRQEVGYVLKQADLKPIEIQADSIKDIVLYKLKSVKDKINGSYFVEDAGFFVDIPLNGFPGVYSSYVLKTIGNEGIIKLIDNFTNSKAHFIAMIALFFKPFEEIYFFEGVVKGKVSRKLKGEKGFGFDPIFIPDSIPHKTFAELSIQEKNKVSHRGQALKKFIDFLKKN